MHWIRITSSTLLLAIFTVNCHCQNPSVSPSAENNLQPDSTIEGLTKKIEKFENEIKINQKEHEQNLEALRAQLAAIAEKFKILQTVDVSALENFKQKLTTLETQLQERTQKAQAEIEHKLDIFTQKVKDTEEMNNQLKQRVVDSEKQIEAAVVGPTNKVKTDHEETKQNLAALQEQLDSTVQKLEALQTNNVSALENFKQKLTTLETQLQERAQKAQAKIEHKLDIFTQKVKDTEEMNNQLKQRVVDSEKQIEAAVVGPTNKVKTDHEEIKQNLTVLQEQLDYIMQKPSDHGNIEDKITVLQKQIEDKITALGKGYEESYKKFRQEIRGIKAKDDHMNRQNASRKTKSP